MYQVFVIKFTFLKRVNNGFLKRKPSSTLNGGLTNILDKLSRAWINNNINIKVYGYLYCLNIVKFQA